MKKYFLLTLLSFNFIYALAQNPDYKVVFDMTSKDTVNQQALIRQLTLIRETNPAATMEVVIYGQGLPLVTRNGSSQEAMLLNLLNDKAISFKVCSATMKRYNVTNEQLLPGVQTVPDGIYEIVTKQKEGWGYIKVGR